MIKTLLKAPVLTQSGYGVHSRQIFNALFEDPRFDLHVEPITWGQTPFLTEKSEQKINIMTCMQKFVAAQQDNNKYDLFVHVTIPNEFEQKGKFNVGVTAGIETDRVSHTWIQKCNEMDMIIVPSAHSKEVFEKTTIEWQHEKTGQRGTFKLQKPLVVCNEGVNTEIFHKFDKLPKNKISDLKFSADFNFLHVGQWGKGSFGEDRKNISNLVRYFIDSFKGEKDTGLVLKINMARNNIMDFDAVTERLKEIKSLYKEDEVPPIHLVHGNLTDEEMATLYNHPQIKAFVSLTHGEGYGLPLVEAAACELPILATNWSGHLDFLKKGKFIALDYDLIQIPEGAVWKDILIKESRWAEVKEDDVKRRLKKVRKDYSIPKGWAKNLGERVRQDLNVKVVQEEFVDAISLGMNLNPDIKASIDPQEHLENFIDTPDAYNVLFTMPRSTGDVFISTAVLDGLMKEVPKESKVYFATMPQYAGLLNGNPHIHKVIPWNQSMMQMNISESVFDLVLTPDIATQYVFSNWIRRGQGRLLAEEYANHCNVELGNYHIETEPVDDLPKNYMTFHPGSGKGQWEARNYRDWPEVLSNIKKFFPDIKIVQVGASDEPEFEEVDVDLRGKTNYQELAYVIKNSDMHLSIDTFTMHVAASFNVPLVAIFGCSYATSTGPWVKDKENAKFILLQSERLSGCRDRACYKNKCIVNPNDPPINEIDPAEIVESCAAFLDEKLHGTLKKSDHKYKRIYGKISGYTTTYNLEGYPFIESIKSMLGFCDEVVIIDGCSDDGTYEILEKLAQKDDRIQLYQREWDFNEPGMDGMQKAFARSLCQHEFLWQQDCDEVVHESDYEKIKMITKRFPQNIDILHLPIIELWGSPEWVTGRRHAWKWRMSRNKPEITHGINKNARLTDEETGKVYARRGMSDGCEYVNAMSYEMLPHTGFWNPSFDQLRIQDPKKYGIVMNKVFSQLPSIYHYSWCSLENKIKQFRSKWDKQWNILYQTEAIERFPGVETEEQIKKSARKLFKEGGEESDKIKYKFKLHRSNPSLMKKWLDSVPLLSEDE